MIKQNLNHLAIIMDGNRRWAKQRLLPSFAGHKAGFDTVQTVSRLAQEKGIKYLTLWALSSENFKKRDSDEINGIIKLINRLPKFVPEFMELGVKMQVIGDIEKLPTETQEIIEQGIAQTSANTNLVLTIALVYGGQDEIVRACKKIIKSGLDPDELTQDTFREYLDTANLPYADIIVRTGGDIRHSGFLLYDSAYSEYYFTDKKWPDFDESELDRVIDFFHGAKRNFGK